MAVEIRVLEAFDRGAWTPLWRAYLDFYETRLPDTTYEVTWTRLLAAAEPMAGALAWSGDRAVGLVHLIRHRSCWTVDDYCYLQDLFVAADLRGAGIGRRLIDYGIEWAKANDCSRIHWLTQETNTGAMKLYDGMADRSGFIQYRKLFSQD